VAGLGSAGCCVLLHVVPGEALQNLTSDRFCTLTHHERPHTGHLTLGRCARISLVDGPRRSPTATSSSTAAAYTSADRLSFRHCCDRHAAEQYRRDDRDPSGNGSRQFRQQLTSA
jgi:hypothetical protein